MTSWPHFEEDEIKAVEAVLRSGKINYWTGDEGRQFEKEFAEFVGCKHGIVLANGTLALELALYALNVGPGDEVITTCRTFIATASAVVMRGAKPILADVDPDTQNITVDIIKTALTPKTKAIIVVHLAGWPCAMDEIMVFAKENNLFVIEDCAQAHGAIYKGKHVGSWGDIGTFSFCQDKIMTTGGEGGMVVTNAERLWKKMWAYKDHGKSYDAVYHKKHPPGFRWLHEDFGTNWRMTEMQAAIGRLQLKKLPEWSERRRHYADRLNKAFSQVAGLRVACPPDDVKHANYKYYVFIEPDQLQADWGRDRIIQAINDAGVFCRATKACPEIYREKCFEKAGWQPAKPYPIARRLGETSLTFEVHPQLTEQDIDKTIEVVRRVVQMALIADKMARI